MPWASSTPDGLTPHQWRGLIAECVVVTARQLAHALRVEGELWPLMPETRYTLARLLVQLDQYDDAS